jgi:hypothetical protein
VLIESIASRTRVPPDKLRRIASNASRRYHEFTIPKRDGTERTIAHPSRPLKALQRFLARNLFGVAPVHSAATAYMTGSNIRDNAARHAHTKFTVRLDFADFFPSFTAASVSNFVMGLSEKYLVPLTEEDVKFVCNIVCRHGILPIGAPSSPKITNAMMFDFDERAFQFARDSGAVYTRYADDIFVSSNDHERLLKCVSRVRDLVTDHSLPPLRLKEEKTLHLSRAGHRSITGLVITPDGSVSLGRDRKREIRTLVYLALSGKIKPDERLYLSGLLAFCYGVEPDFIDRIGRKYSIDVMPWLKTL